MKTAVVVKWHGQADGPWIHIDSILDYLDGAKERLVDGLTPGQMPAARPLLDLLDALTQNYRNLKLQATRSRLEAVAANVDVESLTNDLLSLRDELEGPDHDQ